jgi:D-sedoheptulose 7-phosphate isomerase
MLGATLDLPSYLERLNEEVARLNQADIRTWADLVFEAWKNGRYVFIIGNGGSATTASHMAEDLGKSTLRPADLQDESKQRLKVLSLTDNCGWLLAVGNDCGYDQVFVQQLMNYGTKGDVLLAISGGRPPSASPATAAASSRRCSSTACTWSSTTWEWSRASTCACFTGC